MFVRHVRQNPDLIRAASGTLFSPDPAQRFGFPFARCFTQVRSGLIDIGAVSLRDKAASDIAMGINAVFQHVQLAPA